ncbi:MAG: thioredoxin domain-containing protein [Rhodothermales bacterium]
MAAHRPLLERLLFGLALLGVLTAVHLNNWASLDVETDCLFGTVETPGEQSGCRAALESDMGAPLGVSNAVWGLLYYLAIAGLCAGIAFVSGDKRLRMKRVRGLLIGFGFLYSLFLTGYQYVELPSFCMLCLISASVVSLLFIVQVIYLVKPVDRKMVSSRQLMRDGFLYGGLALVLMLLIGADFLYFNTLEKEAVAEADQPVVATPGERLACFFDTEKTPVENYQALVLETDPTVGSADAPVTIIEFFDPNCPHCKTFHPVMKAMVEKHADQLRVVYKPVAIWNISLGQSAALYAAAEEGKFFEMLELQFAQQKQGGLSLEEVKAIAREVGMNADAMEQRIREGAFNETILLRHQQAQDAGVTGVPAVILNGRFVKSRSLECMNQFIEDAIQNSGGEG